MIRGTCDCPLTMVLVNWRRPDNVHRILEALQSQSVRPKIFLWNNHPTPIFDSRPDWIVNSSRNVHGFPLPFLFRQAETEFVGFQDDDLMPSDPHVLERALETLDRQDDPQRIVGAFGVILEPGRHYRDSTHVERPEQDVLVDVVKARMMLLRTAAASALSDNFANHHVDVWMSTQLADRRRRFHVVAGCFHDGLVELPEGDVGYSRMPGHMAARDAIVQSWLGRVNCADDHKDNPQ